MTVRILGVACLALLISGCRNTPRRIDPTGDEAPISRGLDYQDIVEVSVSLATQMTGSRFLDRFEGPDGGPPLMVLSDVQNKSEQRNLPTTLITSRIREAVLDSGKGQFISSYGSEGTDLMTHDTRDLRNNDEFDQGQIAPKGSLDVAQLSVRTTIDQVTSTDGRSRQRTYEVHMFVTDTKNGRIVWEKRAPAVAKLTEKPGW